MISKGTTHNNGAKLAAYMVTGKEGERAELWQLRGFAATNIKDAFRDVQIMSGATKCEQPFFHVQVRNREGEIMTRQQFEHAADRIERMLGLSGQPRAITFHIYEHNNDQHMHVAWSRIDQDAMRAKPLPFFKERLKKISRELELYFGLEPVTNHREGIIKFAPTRAQDEQARRLGQDPHELRNTIRELWDRSDCGRSFQGALEHEGFTLAQGERRDFVVIDRAGGLHVLGKRILDMTAAKIRDRLSDLSREDLPTVGMARAMIEPEQERPKQNQPEKREPVWDRDSADRDWQDAVIEAAIDRERAKREFVEPEERKTGTKQRRAGAGSRKEKEWPIHPPVPEPIRTAPEYHFEGAAREAGGDRSYSPPKELTGMSKRIMGYVQCLWNEPKLIAEKGKTLSAVLDHEGIRLARVTKDEAERSHREAEFAKEIKRFAPRYKEGEIVAVTEPTLEYRRNGEIMGESPRIHKLDQKAAATFIAVLNNPKQVQGIEATKLILDARAEERAANWAAIRFENATNIKDFSLKLAGKSAARTLKVGKLATRTVGKTLDAFSDAFSSLFDPVLTPDQIRQGEKAKDRREAEADSTVDFARYTSDQAQQRQQQEIDREAERQRARERAGRDR